MCVMYMCLCVCLEGGGLCVLGMLLFSFIGLEFLLCLHGMLL